MGALSRFPLAAIDSATKYPEIPTYHKMGERGLLLDELNVDFGCDPSRELVVTEKIDGTNARIVFDEDGDWMIGLRDHLLAAKGDRVPNDEMGVVSALRPVADCLRATHGVLTVAFFEVYGGKIGKGAANYTSDGATGFRVFDWADISFDVLGLPVEKISAWRQSGGQRFLPFHDDGCVISANGFKVESVPLVGCVHSLPRTIVDTLGWMGRLISTTRAYFSPDGLPGAAEGVVVRTVSRGKIAKLRFEDYRRTLING